MFAEVVLHRRMPKQFDSFTYKIPDGIHVKKGQFVLVPFRKQKLAGIVCKIHRNTPKYPTKFIDEVSDFALSKEQIQLADFLSKKYECSFSKAIDFFVPENVWKWGKKCHDEEVLLSHPVETEIKSGMTYNSSELISKLLKSAKPKLLIENSPIPRMTFYAQIAKLIPQDSQALFLFPEVFHIKESIRNFPVFHGSLKEKQKAFIWHAVRNCEIRALAGTRGALFLPFDKLSCIVVDFAHNENFNEKRAPRYNSIEVAEKLAEIWNIPLIVISATPRVEIWHKMQNSAYKKFEWDKPASSRKVSIINMADERRSGNYGIFASETTKKIATSLSQDQQVLLFINRIGKAGAVMCRDCGNIFRCTECASALTLHNKDILVCRRCKKNHNLLPACDKCGNTKLKSLGFGTEKLETEIKKIFGGAKVLRLDSETVTKRNLEEKTLNPADVLIATQIVDKPLTLPRLRLSIAVMPDSLLNFPDFRATERVFQLLTHIRQLMSSNGEMLIQTFMPEHSLFRYMQKNDLAGFYEEELKARKSLSLPPY